MGAVVAERVARSAGHRAEPAPREAAGQARAAQQQFVQRAGAVRRAAPPSAAARPGGSRHGAEARSRDCKRGGCRVHAGARIISRSSAGRRRGGAELRCHGTQGTQRTPTPHCHLPKENPCPDPACNPILARRCRAARGVTLAVYAPFGTDAVLSTYPGGTSSTITQHPLVKNLVEGGQARRQRLGADRPASTTTPAWSRSPPAARQRCRSPALEAGAWIAAARWPASCATRRTAARARRWCWRWRATAPATCPNRPRQLNTANLTQNGTHRVAHHRGHGRAAAAGGLAAAADGLAAAAHGLAAAAGEPHAAVQLWPRRRR